MSPLVFTTDGGAWRGMLTGAAPVVDLSVLAGCPKLIESPLALTPRQQLFLAELRTAAIVQAHPVSIPHVPPAHYVALRRATVGSEVRALGDMAPSLESLHHALDLQSINVPEEAWRIDVRQRPIPVLFLDTPAIMGEVRARWGLAGIDSRTAPDNDILVALQQVAGGLFAQPNHPLLDTLSAEHEAILRAIVQAAREGTFMLGLSTVLPAIGSSIALLGSVAADARADPTVAAMATDAPLRDGSESATEPGASAIESPLMLPEPPQLDRVATTRLISKLAVWVHRWPKSLLRREALTKLRAMRVALQPYVNTRPSYLASELGDFIRCAQEGSFAPLKQRRWFVRANLLSTLRLPPGDLSSLQGYIRILQKKAAQLRHGSPGLTDALAPIMREIDDLLQADIAAIDRLTVDRGFARYAGCVASLQEALEALTPKPEPGVPVRSIRGQSLPGGGRRRKGGS